MKLQDFITLLLEDDIVLRTTANKPIVKAIKQRNPITFYYSGPYKPKKDSVKRGKRIKAEVVAMGLSKKGNLVVRAWVQPPSVSKKGFNEHGWRTFMVTRMSNIVIHPDETFDTTRPGYKPGDDKSMNVTYVTSDWTKTKPVKKEPAKPESPSKDLVKKADDAIKGVKDTMATKQRKPKPVEKPEPSKEKQDEPKKKEDEPTNTLPTPKPEVKPTPTPEEPPKEKVDLVKKAEDATSALKKSLELKQPKKKEKPSLNLTDIAKDLNKDAEEKKKEGNK
jgi:hypothetical protein